MERRDTCELHRVLADHANRHPLMGPCDAVKLIVQNEFGGRHFAAAPDESLRRLLAEYSALKHDPSVPLLEEVGNGAVRVMLQALDGENYPLEALNRDFVRSARLRTGEKAAFLRKLEPLRELTGQGAFHFSLEDLEAYLGPYLQSGCPPVSHSPEYRRAYHPAYRLVLRRVSLPLLLQEIQARLARNSRVLVAIDGRCASGKTTLARRLHARYGWAVVHLDHFFLRPEQRTDARYATPGENVDHERFLAEVLRPLREGRPPEYRPFDCRTQRLAGPIRVADTPVTLVEGSYACHPELWPYYDLRVFLTVPPEEQRARILARNGPEYARVFQRKWIPLEEAYFSACGIASRCDYLLYDATL